jgi:hypothetical protein
MAELEVVHRSAFGLRSPVIERARHGARMTIESWESD